MRQRPPSPPFNRGQARIRTDDGTWTEHQCDTTIHDKGTTMGHLNHLRPVWVIWHLGEGKFLKDGGGYTRYIDEAERYTEDEIGRICGRHRGAYAGIRLEWSALIPETTTPALPAAAAGATVKPDFVLCVSTHCGTHGPHMVCTVPDCEFVVDHGRYDQVYLSEFRQVAEQHLRTAHPQNAGGTE